MKVDNVVRTLRVLLRANTIIADIYLRNALARAGIYAFAGLIAAFGLLMLGIGLFFALEQLWGPVWAAVAVGGGNVVLALILALIAAQVKPGRDLELANEINQSAMDALTVELKTVEQDVRGLTNIVRNPLDSALSGMLVPVLGMVLKTLRRK
ncbi:phage holin family protein [Aquabacter sp. P-9]|uniref:phage holin family protein n=1 Tax=Aquabacter sediminis TaxID=3029197 RepID=UPI00237DF829|nr:phage holin family protein [Aquabacter sp. P-9]MDE1568717.1 phage holin family protein [Aquabacter sp. P-9]